MNKLDIAKKVIEVFYPYADCGIFNTRNTFGDSMTTVYQDDKLTIDICYYFSYFEVFGLSNDEFEKLEIFYNTLGYKEEQKIAE